MRFLSRNILKLFLSYIVWHISMYFFSDVSATLNLTTMNKCCHHLISYCSFTNIIKLLWNVGCCKNSQTKLCLTILWFQATRIPRELYQSSLKVQHNEEEIPTRVLCTRCHFWNAPKQRKQLNGKDKQIVWRDGPPWKLGVRMTWLNQFIRFCSLMIRICITSLFKTHMPGYLLELEA